MKLKNLSWGSLAFFAIAIGLYPLTYYIVDMRSAGLLQSKPKELLNSTFYIPVFYTHITFGGIALLSGWTQFSRKLRDKNLNMHRWLGKVYVIAVVFSSLAGLFIAFFASGGIISSLGFGLLAILWFATVVKAYTSIRKKKIREHENWMIRNYALAFAAVTLRIYLPLSQAAFHIDFTLAYRAISWLCWVPNLIIAGIIISRRSDLPVYIVKSSEEQQALVK
jgi:uncharacterized membrane protein